MNPNGLRIGSPVITTRGLIEEDCELVGALMAKIIKNPENEETQTQVKEKVAEICKKYPLYTN